MIAIRACRFAAAFRPATPGSSVRLDDCIVIESIGTGLFVTRRPSTPPPDRAGRGVPEALRSDEHGASEDALVARLPHRARARACACAAGTRAPRPCLAAEGVSA